MSGVFWPLPRLNVLEVTPLHDETDRVQAAHYGFMDEELDIIINDDILSGFCRIEFCELA